MKKRKVFLTTALCAAVLFAAQLACETISGGEDAGTNLPSDQQPAQSTIPDAISEPPAGGLSQTGPWLVFSTDGGLWAVNPDGSGLVQLTNAPIHRFHTLNEGLAAVGGHLAFINGSDDYHDLKLQLLTLPGGSIYDVAMLINDDLLAEIDADPAMRPPEAIVAITQEQILAWSPDGETLAFMGAIDGLSSDLYTYMPQTGAIQRITDGPSQAFAPSWSPDGTNILHFGAETLGSGAGYLMSGVWIADANASEVTALYDPSQSYGERVFGWLDESSFVVASWNPSCGLTDLREYNILTQTSEILWDYCFTDAAINTEDRGIVFVIDEYVARDNPQNQMGVFVIAPGASEPIRVLDDIAYQVEWSAEKDIFFTSTEFGIQAITSNGEWVQIDSPSGSIPIASLYSGALAWNGLEGLWIGELTGGIDNPPQHIFTKHVVLASWAPRSESILFFTKDHQFYIASAPDYEPLLLSEDLYTTDAVWVWP